jgi:DnaJ-domain-containing protein 1
MGPAAEAPLRLRSSLGRYRPHFHFSGPDEALLAAFTPSATIAEAAARTGQSQERAAQVAHTLWACQMLKPTAALRDPATVELPTRASDPASRPSGPDQASRPSGPDPADDRPTEPVRKASIGAGPISPERISEFAAELQRIESAVASGAHAFDLLGLPRTAERPQIRAAWHALSRRFHPDALHHSELGHLRERSEAVFASLNEAYQILSDPAQREELVALLRAGMRPGTGPHTPVPTPQAILESDVAMREADTLLRVGNFERALERYHKAASLSPDEVEPQVAIAWCEYQRSPDRVGRHEATRTVLLAIIKGAAAQRPGPLLPRPAALARRRGRGGAGLVRRGPRARAGDDRRQASGPRDRAAPQGPAGPASSRAPVRRALTHSGPRGREAYSP